MANTMTPRTVSLRIRTLAEAETAWPGFRRVWAAIKASTGTRQRAPKRIVWTTARRDVCANDYDCCARFAVELSTGRVSEGVHVSCGEWATANRGEERALDGIPAGVALVTCTWNDYYRTFTLDVEVNEGELRTDLLPTTAEVR